MMEQAEKAALDFEKTNWEGRLLNTGVREVTETLITVAQRVLYHWKCYPINLPLSIADDKSLCLKDLFILPSFDEMETVTTDSKGNPKFLDHNQLHSVKRAGEFRVASVNFPGQSHVWRLNPIFQKGSERAKEEFLDGVAFGLRFLVVYIPDLIVGCHHSLFQALKLLGRDVIRLIDLLFGFGRVHVPNLERRIHEERSKFLVAELRCKGGNGAREVGRYVRNQATKAMREKVTLAMERPPKIPYRFTTPTTLDVDLRLFDKNLMRKLGGTLSRVLEKASRGWFLSFREKVIAQMRSKKISIEEMELEANTSVMEEYLKRISAALRSFPEILELDRLLIQEAQLHVLMQRAVDNVGLKLQLHLVDEKKSLMGNSPILSRDPVWMEIQMNKARKSFCTTNIWMPHELALDFCRDRFLKQHSYFLQRDLTFMQDTEKVLRKEIQADKVPCRTFEWKTLIWRPENYIIMRTLNGQTETIPTVVSQMTTTITSPRTGPYHPTYNMRRTISRYTTTRWPFWRLTNTVFRTMCWMLNTMYWLGYVIPWKSSFGLRALVLGKPFLTSLVLNQVNGTICPKKSSETLTLKSRLMSIWRQVSKGRTKFESEPDTGFLGKGVERFLNCLWNYGCKGILPTLVLLLLFPPASLLISIGSICLALVTPIWMPVVVILFDVICILIYDFDSPKQRSRRNLVPVFVILFSILIKGIFQFFMCLLAILLCPFISFLVLFWSSMNYGLRLCWDGLVFLAIIKPNGRLPATNSCLVKRIMGPGLAPQFYFKIGIEQALIAFQARLELEELNIFQQHTNKILSQPQLEYKNFFTSCFSSFSGRLVENEGPYHDLIRETQILRATLEEKVVRRRNRLEIGLGVDSRSRVRMPKTDLEKTLLAARRMSDNFFRERIFQQMNTGEACAYWEGKGLEENDWKSLTAILITEVFSQDFLSPLEEGDVAFSLDMSLERNPIPIESYLKNAEEDYWSGEEVVMSRVNYRIHSPYLDVSVFNPCPSKSTYLSNLSLGRLEIPLPIPHPASISIYIYNRETDHPFQWETPITHAILKALQESVPMVNQDCISLDIDTSLSSSDDFEEDTEGRISPSHDDFLNSPSPIVVYVPEDSRSTSTSLKSPIVLEDEIVVMAAGDGVITSAALVGGASSKASLASPEESLEEVIHSKFGTSV